MYIQYVLNLKLHPKDHFQRHQIANQTIQREIIVLVLIYN